MPDNKSTLELMRCHTFYDLYWILITYIFGKYGQGSLRAEAELSKMLILPILYEDSHIGHNDDCTALYQFGRKKLYIVLNEMARNNGVKNPACIATGHDRHVKRFAEHFNPYLGFSEKFTKILCQIADDWILWNFNEFVGQLQQCIKSTKNSAKERFALAVLGDLIYKHEEYNSLVMTLVNKRQWKSLTDANNVREGAV